MSIDKIRNNIYLASLLHDIGYFEKMTYGLSDNHEELSIKLLNSLAFIETKDREVIEVLVRNHHNPQNLYELMVRLGDLLSCNEEGYVEDREGNEKINLSSIFYFINDNDKLTKEKIYKYPSKEIGGENIFADSDINNRDGDYKKHFDNFKKEIDRVENETQLLFLMEKYLWCIPIVEKSLSNADKREDISLYHHLRTSAAISIALYDEMKDQKFEDLRDEFLDYSKDESSLKDRIDDRKFILINGDVSGIQDFLLNIESKNAAKTLKGNSVYINLLTDVVANYMLNMLNLKEVNLIYNGGGTFFILTSMNKKQEIEILIRQVMEKIFKIHKGEIFYALDYIQVSPSKFIDFSSQWTRAIEKTNRQKEKKWSQLDLGKNYSKLFCNLDDGVEEDMHCKHCGLAFEASDDGLKEDHELCDFCKSSMKLSEKIRDAKYFVIENIDIEDLEDIESYDDGFKLFGYKLGFKKEQGEIFKKENQKVYLINDYDFLNQEEIRVDGYKIGAYQLPSKEEGAFLDFDALADKSLGRGNLLGVLKLDVDNLGNIFRLGLGKNKTIARMMTLSRMMTLFFEGYINQLLDIRINDFDTIYVNKNDKSKDYRFKDLIYLVYSGGDDTFLVGGWYEVYLFAKLFRSEFERYVCQNDTISFSAGLGFFNAKYPVINSIDITEDYLSEAKEYKNKYDEKPKKNKINLMGEIFNWNELKKIDDFIKILDEAIKKLGEDKTKGKSILWKVEKSSLGFKNILEDSNRGQLHPNKIAKLAYYLRDLKKIETEKDEKNKESNKRLEKHTSDKILEEYKNIVISNVFDEKEKKIENIMIIPVATRITELKNRDKGENSDGK